MTEYQYSPEDPLSRLAPPPALQATVNRFERVEAGLLAQGFRFRAKLKKKDRVSSKEMEKGPSLGTILFVPFRTPAEI